MNPAMVMEWDIVQMTIANATECGRADALASHEDHAVLNSVDIARRAYDAAMQFFQRNHDLFWRGTAGWWDRDFLYLYIAAYARQWPQEGGAS